MVGATRISGKPLKPLQATPLATLPEVQAPLPELWQTVLEETPPELAADIIDKGIVMAGGTSQLSNLDKLMTKLTGVVCHVAEEPLLCVVRGTGVAIENIELYKRSINKK